MASADTNSTCTTPISGIRPSFLHEQTLAALLSGEVDAHVRNFARHLRSANMEDQWQLLQLLDAMDELATVNMIRYCQIVQRLSEKVLQYSTQYLVSRGSQFSPDDLKIDNVLRLLWMSSLYKPVSRRLCYMDSELFPVLNEICLNCLHLQKETEPAVSTDLDSPTSDIGYNRTQAIMVSALALLHNALAFTNDPQHIAVSCHSGLVNTITKLVTTTKNIFVAEICLKIIDCIAESGNSVAVTSLNDCRVMRAASGIWAYIVAIDPTLKSGIHIAELIARIGENLRRAKGCYKRFYPIGFPGTKRDRLIYRNPTIKMVHWCSWNDCGKAEDRNNHLKVCSRCMLCRYCNEACQRAHWENGHDLECFIVKKPSFH
ncbi:uncharacterized protein [Antedon mediterranea]|uniref:uncharacterized protein n=1 Tax=Antedon mediterranea TaxID=105859 RepID=UPI003AF7941A